MKQAKHIPFTTDRKIFLLLITIFAICCIAIVTLITSSLTKPHPTQPTTATFTGNLTCLPHKNVEPGQPQTLECAIGLITNDKRYFRLQELSQKDSATPFTKQITVTGELYPSEMNERYNTQGTIKVTKFTINQ